MHLPSMISDKKIQPSYLFMWITLFKSNLLPQTIHEFLPMFYLTVDRNYSLTEQNYYHSHMHKPTFFQHDSFYVNF